jgi:HD-like signal output (HDOD) protein
MADNFQRRINEQDLTLPMLPTVTTEVLLLVDDEHCNSAKLAKLIESDQSLAGHVMRLVNSVMFCPTGQIDSLQQAITRLGMGNISEIAVAISVSPKLFQIEGYEDLVQAQWQTSLATASWARAIARQQKLNGESVFLCGLLHQIGKPVVLQTAIELSKQHGIQLRDELIEQLLASFEVLVGADLAKRWNLPEAVVATIAGFSGHEIDESYLEVFNTVYAARVLAEFMLNTEHMDADNLTGHHALEAVKLSGASLEMLLENQTVIRAGVKALLV